RTVTPLACCLSTLKPPSENSARYAVPAASTVESATRPSVASSSAPIGTCSDPVNGTKSLLPGRRSSTVPATGSTSALCWKTGGGTDGSAVVVVAVDVVVGVGVV